MSKKKEARAARQAAKAATKTTIEKLVADVAALQARTMALEVRELHPNNVAVK